MLTRICVRRLGDEFGARHVDGFGVVWDGNDLGIKFGVDDRTRHAADDPWFDPNSVGGDMVVECWISHGPRADDATFDPVASDWLTVGDGDEAPLRPAW